MITGINTELLRKLCLDVQDYADKIKNTLNQIEDVSEEVMTIFEGSGSLEFKNKFAVLKESFSIIYENITSYIDDFNNLNSKYENFDSDLSSKVKIDAEKIDGKEVY